MTLFCAMIALSAVAQTKAPAAQQPKSSSAQATLSTSLDGEWSGALQVEGAPLKLVLHLSSASDGALLAKLDSPEQGVYGMDASSISREQSKIHFEVASVGASFDGTISPDRRSINGSWQQGESSLPLTLRRQTFSAIARRPLNAVSALEGKWQALLVAGKLRLRIQLRVAHDPKGTLTAGFDSLDEGINNLAAAKVSEKAGEVHFEITPINASFDGTLSANRNELSGRWTQGEANVPLTFTRSDVVLDAQRPQNPAKPLPYQEEEVRFTNTKAQATLAGTLTIPTGAGPFPAALLIGDTGPFDRDESLAGHKPFLVLADYLTRKGFAVLHYDKRGIARSSGEFDAATTAGFADDAQAALTFLKSRKEVDAKKVGLIGHGEGGIIAPMLATPENAISWLVLLAPPATNGEDTLLRQSELIARVAGMPEAQIKMSLAFDRRAYTLVKQEANPLLLKGKLDELVTSSGIGGAEGSSPAAVQAQIRRLTLPWFRYFLLYDPVPTLQKVKIPVLALIGDKDLQTPSDDNIPLLKKALEDGGNKNATVTELPGLNHLFQEAQMGSPSEYGAIEETISPSVLETVVTWITKQTATP